MSVPKAAHHQVPAGVAMHLRDEATPRRANPLVGVLLLLALAGIIALLAASGIGHFG